MLLKYSLDGKFAEKIQSLQLKKYYYKSNPLTIIIVYNYTYFMKCILVKTFSLYIGTEQFQYNPICIMTDSGKLQENPVLSISMFKKENSGNTVSTRLCEHPLT